MLRTIVVIVVSVILAAVGFVLWHQSSPASGESGFDIVREAEAARNPLLLTVFATGSIEPETMASLSFNRTGTIQQILVDQGESIQEGEVLATLDSGELELAAQQAQDALKISQLTLDQYLNRKPGDAVLAAAQADIDAAEAQIAIAEANLAAAEAAVQLAESQKAQLFSGPTSGAVAAAEADIARARLQKKNAEETHNLTMECEDVQTATGETQEVCPGLGPAEEQARAELENVTIALEAAEKSLDDLLAGPRPADIQTADAAIASAEAEVLAAQGSVLTAEANRSRAKAAYDQLLEPPSESEKSLLEAQVDSAQTILDLAELRLEQAMIISPISGKVANVLQNPGEQAVPGAPVMTVVDEDAFHIDVNVDEVDIDRIGVGQTADITLDALPDRTISGKILEIGPTSAGSSGVVTYLVTIGIDETHDLVLRPGMSATAAIIVDEVDDVLVVPNWAIRWDRESGQALVNLKTAGQEIREVVVETGIQNDTYSEIISGLQEGDVVVLTNKRETFSLFGTGDE
jgi:HlyD family secretion protein